ncbi:hypothetical protein UPYG_G00200800 [Umbra pygmaea]|uniref:Uncharacterized protein n=1 Tax=Umbra pygmaea TaxID=75934 RepID=A0ABD0WJ37_UMBPY
MAAAAIQFDRENGSNVFVITISVKAARFEVIIESEFEKTTRTGLLVVAVSDASGHHSTPRAVTEWLPACQRNRMPVHV